MSQPEPEIAFVLGELPTIDRAPIVRSFIAGAVLANDRSPEVKFSNTAGLLPPTYGPGALDVVPPGAIATLALPKSTSSRAIDSRE